MNISRVKITHVAISNFRSFPPRDVNSACDVSGLANINVFVGPNGAGKSVLFNAMRDCFGWDSFNGQGTYTIERNYRDPTKRIEVIIGLDVDGPVSLMFERGPLQGDGKAPKPTRRTEPVLNVDLLRTRCFPNGLPRKFSEFNVLATNAARDGIVDHNYERIFENWNLIRQDAQRIEIKLRESPPKAPRTKDEPVQEDYGDRFLWDMLDKYDVPVLESSDGKANFLFMIVCIRTVARGSVILIEEPENHMHPALQKQFLEYMRELSSFEKYQFFVSTHSPYLINLASVDENIKLFRVSKDKADNTLIEDMPGRSKRAHWQVLMDLGHSSADVLQVNGVIWVEGPSDRIYLCTWLEKLAPQLQRGRDYEVMWYGGALFTYIDAGDDQEVDKALWNSANLQDTLIALFDLNPNWAFLIDSDSDNAKIPAGTQRKKDEFLERCKGHVTWKVNPYIEKQITEQMGWSLPLSEDKPEWARRYRQRVSVQSEAEVRSRLSQEANWKVQQLIAEIKKWNNRL